MSAGEEQGLVHSRSLVRGVALAVVPVMVGAFAVSALTTPARSLAGARALLARRGDAGRADRIRPVSQLQLVGGVPVAVPVNPAPLVTLTVRELATNLGIDGATVRWANDLGERQEAVPGQRLVLPPGDGSLMPLRPGESVGSFSQRTGVPLATIAAFNGQPEAAGRRYLQVPAGTPGADLRSSDVVVLAPGIPAVSTGQRGHGGNNFPFGQCTWYVASRRNVTWNGDAGQWLAAARHIRPEGRVPVVGAIAVQRWISPPGHVSYVEAVNDDGSFRIAEMNYEGLGVVDHRTMSAQRDGVAGFIY